MTRLLFAIYHLAWLAALPLLKRSARISLGWDQRTLQDAPRGPFDLWIQAASGGESLLVNSVLSDIGANLPAGASLRILATSGTQQGIDSLHKGCRERGDDSPLHTVINYFPFDNPALMAQAFQRYSPRLIVIVETELWPGLLYQAKKSGVPVLLINGRMSAKSFRSYRFLHWLFKPLRPERIWAISKEDGDRFARVMGAENIGCMNNIKFDRIEPQNQPAAPPRFAHLLPHHAPFVLLGSIRREEEEKILITITGLLKARPDIVIGLFPKHIERADAWLEMLGRHRIGATKRSAATGTCRPGTVMVWDVFGELAGAYALARVTFIGGSLEDLGGQNFLEPLVFGLKPFIGPFWSSFAWVSREIVDSGLVHEIRDERQLLDGLLIQLDREEPREQVMDQVQQFLAPRKGGTRLAGSEILNFLKSASDKAT